jgi:D-inositol-3-phosphate glycosyltransferase
MKITIVGPVYPYRGGIAHYTAMLARALEQNEIRTQVISFRRQYPGWLYPGVSDKDPSEQRLLTNALFLLDPLYPWTWLRTEKEIIAAQPTGVLFQWWTTFWAIPYAIITKRLRKAGLSVVYVIHNVLPHEISRPDAWLARQALSQASSFIVQSSIEENRLRALLPTANYRLCAMPSYSIFYEGRIDKEVARRKLNLPQAKYVLLFFGLVRPYKGLDVLLEALSLLSLTGDPPHLIVAGEFWEGIDRYQKKIRDNNLTESVLIDNRYIPDEEVGAFFSAADCMVAPYTGGTQSASTSIAAAIGLPMIVTERVAEGIAEENKHLILDVVPPGDAHALASAIRTAMEKPYTQSAPLTSTKDGWDRLIKLVQQLFPQ